MSQNEVIKKEMTRLMKDGMVDKHDIFDHLHKVMGFKRPTIRRVAGDLRTELKLQLQILSSDVGKNGTS